MRVKNLSFASNTGSRVVKSLFVLIIILSACSLNFAQTSTEGTTSKMTQPGAPAGSYPLSGFESVNLFNGNLNFNLPLVKIGGRGKAQSSINIVIDSAKWDLERDPRDTNNFEGPSIKHQSTVFERTELSASNENECDEKLAADASIVNYFACIMSIEGENVSNPLGSAEVVSEPGYFYSSYWVRESTMPRPGYNPGLIYARRGKMWNMYLTRIYFTASDGTEYELRDEATDGKPIYRPFGNWVSRGQNFSSTDGAGLRFVSATAINDNIVTLVDEEHEGMRVTGTLYFPDGTKYEINDGDITQIKDINGNKIIYTYNVFHKVTNIVDSLGRQVVVAYNIPANDPNDPDLTYDTISSQKSSTEWQTLKVYKTKLGKALRSGFDLMTYEDMFGPPSPTGGPGVIYNPGGVVTKIVLPDNRSYQLFYTPYNEIARIQLPTGGAFEYDFPMPSFEWGTIFRPVIERRVYASGGGSAGNDPYNSKQKYIRHNLIGSFPNVSSYVTVEEHSGSANSESAQLKSKSEHYFHGLPNMLSHKFYPLWNEGREYKTEVLDPNDVLKRRTDIEWVNPLTVAWGDVKVSKMARVKSMTSTVFEGSQSLTSKFEYGYDNNSLTNNKTDEWIYDYGIGAPGRLLRHNKTTYLKVNPLNNQDYTGPNIYLLTLPETKKLYEVKYDLTEILVSQSETKYDEMPVSGNLANCGISLSLTGWNEPATSIRGNATTLRVWNNTNNTWIETHAETDCFGNPIKSWDANGNLSRIEYSSAYLYTYPTKTITPIPGDGTHGANQAFETNTVFDFYSGSPLTITDPNQQVTSAEYADPLLRPTKIIGRNGQQTIFEYGDTIGNLYLKTKKQIDEFNWDESTTFFDGLGRNIKTQAKDSQGDVFVQTKYDNMGRVKLVSNPYRENGALLWRETTYDSLNRIIKVKAPDTTEITTAFSLATGGVNIGTAATVTDQASKVKRAISNSLGQLVQIDDPSSTGTLDPLPQGTPQASPSPTPDPTPPADAPTCYTSSIPNCTTGMSVYPMTSTYYKYDGGGNISKITQGEQIRTYTYDSLNRLLSATNPESGTVTYTYDANGNLLTKVDARNITNTNTYDAMNRVVSRSYTDSTPPVTYFYDNLANAKGKLIKVTSSVSTTEYTAFDDTGQILAHKQTTDGQVFDMAYKYNLSGGLIEETYPSGEIVRSFLQSDGDLDIVAVSGRTYASDFSYTTDGAVSSLRLGNGNWESTQFNSRRQPTQIALGTSKNATDLMKLIYDYGDADNNGNVLSQTVTVPTVGQNPGFTAVQTYTYDSLNRLRDVQEMIGSTPTWKQTLLYDRYGNRNFDEANTTTLPKNCLENSTSAVCASDRKKYNPSVDLTSNRLDPSESYGYDAAGNITTDAQGRTLTYNAENKQKSVTDGNNNFTYFYDGNGKRVKKVSNNEVTVFVYDASGLLVAEYGGPAPQNPQVNYLTKDLLGSLRVSTGANAGVLARHDYYPYGEEILTSQRIPGLNYSPDNNRKKFTGYERDTEIDLDFAQARYYSPKIGRFMSPDEFTGGPEELADFDGKVGHNPTFYAELTDPRSLNKYSYCLNNPIIYTDPDGHQTLTPDWLWVAIDNVKKSIEKLIFPLTDELQEVKNGEPPPQKVNTPLRDFGDGNGRNLVKRTWKQMATDSEAAYDVISSFDVTGVSGGLKLMVKNIAGQPPSKTEYMIVIAGMVLTRGKGTGGASIALSEAKQLVGGWAKGSFANVAQSIRYHANKHMAEVGAKNFWQYLKKAENFAREVISSGVKGTPVPGVTQGVRRFELNGRYIDLAPGGKIVSFGTIKK